MEEGAEVAVMASGWEDSALEVPLGERGWAVAALGELVMAPVLGVVLVEP